MEKTSCCVCLNGFAERGIEPNDIALPIPAGSDMLVLRPQMFAYQMKVLKCAC